METTGREGRIESILKTVLKAPELQVSRSTTAFDVKGWDSLSNIKLVVAIEKEFKIKFSASEVVQLKNVGDLMDAVAQKCS